ncbi:hypothetical protein DUI87_17005 [Hirundo rustica rustica]|uniref:C->U-editing enzyme APOBEC-1 n=1 Tax=Hirundo rustica rustica TaxID=333673 RepID=A0A3M0K4Y7_HIRRU|nr:hypothetical protein DUI87_17005 [Hirundo rustica rustica]
MYISKKALRRHFDPRVYPRETYLLCELQWEGSRRVWIHWIRNVPDHHAEEYFLEEVFEPRNYGFCNITLYLSWSPCCTCCSKIRDFLKRNPNVKIDIRVARLIYPDYAETRSSLRELNGLQRVSIQVMEAAGLSCIESKNHRISQVERDPKGSSSPTLFTLQDHLKLSNMTESVIQDSVSIQICYQMRILGFQCHIRWKLQPEDFQRNYSPNQIGRVVYLLYEVRWRRGSIWRNWCSNNPEQHAEVNFLENHFHHRPQTPCSITWFLSTSPCGKCSRRILEFLKSQPNVTLEIYAAKLFRHHDIRNRQGLRNLMMNGVTIYIMNLEGNPASLCLSVD